MNYRIFFYFYTLLILFLMIYPFVSTGNEFSNIDKWIHFLIFFVYSFLAGKAFTHLNNLLLIGLLAIYAAMLELGQGLLSYRAFETLDLIANFAGILTGSFMLYVLKFLKTRNYR